MDCDETRWVELNPSSSPTARCRTVEFYCHAYTDFRSKLSACFKLLQIRFFFKTPEILSRALRVFAGASSLSHFNTFHLTLCEFFHSFLTECPPFGEHEPFSVSYSLPVITAVGRSICVLNSNPHSAVTYSSIMPHHNTCLFTCSVYLASTVGAVWRTCWIVDVVSRLLRREFWSWTPKKIAVLARHLLSLATGKWPCNSRSVLTGGWLVRVEPLWTSFPREQSPDCRANRPNPGRLHH